MDIQRNISHKMVFYRFKPGSNSTRNALFGIKLRVKDETLDFFRNSLWLEKSMIFSADFCAERGSHTQRVDDEREQKSAKKDDLNGQMEFRKKSNEAW